MSRKNKEKEMKQDENCKEGTITFLLTALIEKMTKKNVFLYVKEGTFVFPIHFFSHCSSNQ